MLRLTATLVPCLVLGALTTSLAQAGPHVVYTRHALKVDVHDLDLRRDADRHVFQDRITDAADKVCGGGPDRGNRYSGDELKLLMPAFNKCHADAVRSAQASAKVPLVAELAGTDR